MRTAGRPHGAQSCRCCPGTSPVRKLPGRSSTSHQSAPSRGSWSPWCLWELCIRWRSHPGRWHGKFQAGRCCRSEGPRAERPPHTASSACPPKWALSHWAAHCRSPCAPSLCEEKGRHHQAFIHYMTVTDRYLCIKSSQMFYNWPCMLG